MTMNGPVTNRQLTAADTPAAAVPPAPSGPWWGHDLGRRITATAAKVAGVWLLALLAHLAHADALTLLLVVAGTGASLRGAGSLLDRLMLSVALLAGLTCVAALGLSFTPGHLRPQVLGGCALTGLVLVAAVRGGLPGRWRRPRLIDLAVLLPVAAVAYLFTRPTLGAGMAVRLGTVIRGEDLARHFAMFDTIRRVGGYVFLHRAAAAGSIAPSDLAYPQGAHLLAAVVDGFLSSSSSPGAPVTSMSHFLYYDQFNYLFLVLAVIWAARRLAGPGVRAVAFLPVAGLCAGYLLFGSLITAYTYGFFPEIAGLAFLALLVGVLVRPLPDTREQVLIVAALVVAVAYCYYILLPVVAVAVLGYAWVYRRRLARHRVLVGAVTVAGALACLVLRVAAGHEQALSLGVLLQDFGVARVQRGPLLGLAALVAVGGAATRSWWRSPAARIMAVSATGAAALTLGVGLYEVGEVGHTLYFFEKSLHTLIVLMLVASGAAAGLAQRLIIGLRSRVALAAGALLLGLVPSAMLGGLDWDPQQQADAQFHDPAYGTSPGRLLVGGQLAVTQPAMAAVTVANAIPDAGGKITLIATDQQTDNLATFYTWMLQRQYGAAWQVYPKTFTMHGFYQYEEYLISDPGRHYRVVTSDPTILIELESLAILRPDLQLEVDDLHNLRRQ
ncbi:hypothetical protein GCM10023322_14910 [Rugosimonospora acidiphila]|uniref:Glycosyltransferase RgtA/B/C/D-like domain-containing protein n=1 Tax=Rugosimonospora acidiphila TaxID=556531 RepID=A0ABP9RNU2_9ACTN